MSRHHQLIGIIDIDVDPNLDIQDDGTIGETLRALRIGPGRSVGAAPPVDDDTWIPDGEPVESVQFLTANLDQLNTDLELELIRFVDRLLTTM